jgi:NADPH-dependent 2,4-dienoyl-CoA reductase/sulfur reductase-like enzyme
MARCIVVVGGSLAGIAAAERARDVDPRARIVLVERQPQLNVAAAGIAQLVSGEASPPAALERRKRRELERDHRVELRLKSAVTRIDARRRIVELSGGDSVKCDALVFASGAGSVPVNVRGLDDAENVVAFRLVADAARIQAARRAGARNVTVVGGGSMGVEAADALARAGWKVVLLERRASILPGFSAVASEAGECGLSAMGVRVVRQARVTEVVRKGSRVVALCLADGTRIASDVVVVAAGVRPRTELLAATGCDIRPDGSVTIDAHCRTSLSWLHACGTCVAVPHAVTLEPTWMPQAAVADRSARVAGACAAGGSDVLAPVAGTQIVRAGTIVVGRTGLSPEDSSKLRRATLHAAAATAPARDVLLRDDVGRVHATIWWDHRTRSLIGAETWGEEGVDKRLDVLATAITGALTIDDLAGIDFGHAPPFAPARDVLNIVAQAAVDKMARASRRGKAS